MHQTQLEVLFEQTHGFIAMLSPGLPVHAHHQSKWVQTIRSAILPARARQRKAEDPKLNCQRDPPRLLVGPDQRHLHDAPVAAAGAARRGREEVDPEGPVLPIRNVRRQSVSHLAIPVVFKGHEGVRPGAGGAVAVAHRADADVADGVPPNVGGKRCRAAPVGGLLVSAGRHECHREGRHFSDAVDDDLKRLVLVLRDVEVQMPRTLAMWRAWSNLCQRWGQGHNRAGSIGAGRLWRKQK
mmetsp:Transcript_98067/g.315893  ORF Transcript_98067/g.315893 Transcript_98067/m.315893 type:complete len:240 (-) Transcript_98067:81-800(-)